MKIRLLLFICFISPPVFAQFFVNSGAVMGINPGVIVIVKGMDVENQGDISHAGDLEVYGNIINANLWVCDASQLNRIALTSDWTNNALFNPGIGRVEFTGNKQNIGGTAPTAFYNLFLKGISGDIKTQLSTLWCLDSLYLNEVELATNGNTFSLRNGLIPVQRTTGYISTFNKGIVKIVFPSVFGGNTNVPLGYGMNPAQYKPVFLISPNSDSFDVSLFGNSPTVDGLNSNSLQDSLCGINNNYYYRILTFGSPVFYAITQSSNEQNYTKLARWNGTKWEKISSSGPSGLIATPNLALNAQSASVTEYISQAIEKPYVNAGPDIIVNQGYSVQLKTNGYFPKGSTISWNPSSDLSCDNCPNPLFTMGSPGIYSILVSNGPNCEAVDSIYIGMILNYKKMIPNAFTPNDDQLNEGFGPVLFPGDKLENLKIFNRYGEKIYEGTVNWDGSYQGLQVMAGVYVYEVSIIRNNVKGAFNNSINFSGNVTVLR